MDIDVVINEVKDTSPSNFEEHNAIHSTTESNHGTSMTKEEAAIWANWSQIQQKNYCIAAHSKVNEVHDIDVTINEGMASDSEPMSSDNSQKGSTYNDTHKLDRISLKL